MNRILALTVLLTLAAGEASAQCSGGSCSPSFAPAARLLEGWHPAVQWPGWLLYYRAGVVTAGYRPETDAYCTYSASSNAWGPISAPPWGARPSTKDPVKLNFGVDEDKLGKPRTGVLPGVGESRQPAPIDLAAAAAARAKSLVDELLEREPIQNFGVESSQLSHGNSDRYLRNGHQVTRDEALRAIGSLNDDSKKRRLTIIGPEADRKTVLEDLSRPPLSELKGQLIVQAYAPDHWHVARMGYKTDGKPTIYLLEPPDQNGSAGVLHRQDDYAGGAPLLAQAIRKAADGYDPAKDPNVNKPAPAPGAPDWLAKARALLPVEPWIAVAIAAAAGLWYFRQPGSATPVQPLTQPVESRRESPPRWKATGIPSIARIESPPPLPPAAIQSRPDLTLGRLLQDQLEREQREEEEAKRRAAAREAERVAFRKFAGLDVPAPNPVPVVPSPDPEKKG